MNAHALNRRRLLQLLGTSAAGLPLAGAARAQQTAEPTLFLEVNLRGQVDLMHVMVPPSIARYPQQLVTGSNGMQLTLFTRPGELSSHGNEIFLTDDSRELEPHLDTVAMLDTGQMAIGGVHGLEAACGMRSPGRVMDGGASGLQPMWLNDGEHAGESEELYGNVPTPATFHNYYQLEHAAGPGGAYTFKGVATSKTSVYHFAAGLPGAELARIKSKEELMMAYAALYSATGKLPNWSETVRALSLPAYLKRGGPGEQALVRRFESLALVTAELELSAEEIHYWSTGVPPQKCEVGNAEVLNCGADEFTAVSGGWVKAQIWEQFGWASKLMRTGLVRSAAIEFSYGHLDGDGVRTESVQRDQAQQIARPLARFIAHMKEAGLYDRTVIAVYLVDGSHEPGANTYSDRGKGTFILAGGAVQGGYYGDIQIDSALPNGAGHTYSFRPPDPATGQLLPAVADWNDRSKRTPDASVWRTVAKALRIPESEYVGKFSKLLDDGVPLDCMLRG